MRDARRSHGRARDVDARRCRLLRARAAELRTAHASTSTIDTPAEIDLDASSCSSTASRSRRRTRPARARSRSSPRTVPAGRARRDPRQESDGDASVEAKYDVRRAGVADGEQRAVEWARGERSGASHCGRSRRAGVRRQILIVARADEPRRVRDAQRAVRRLSRSTRAVRHRATQTLGLLTTVFLRPARDRDAAVRLGRRSLRSPPRDRARA